jgi:hypothetical protein
MLWTNLNSGSDRVQLPDHSKVFVIEGRTMLTSAICNNQHWSGLKVQYSALVVNLNFEFSMMHWYGGLTINKFPPSENTPPCAIPGALNNNH